MKYLGQITVLMLFVTSLNAAIYQGKCYLRETHEIEKEYNKDCTKSILNREALDKINEFKTKGFNVNEKSLQFRIGYTGSENVRIPGTISNEYLVYEFNYTHDDDTSPTLTKKEIVELRKLLGTAKAKDVIAWDLKFYQK